MDAFECRGPKPGGILTNSELWQNEEWNRATTKIQTAETRTGYLRLAALMGLRRHAYDAVYTVGIRPALAYGLLRRVIGHGGIPHIASEILLDEPDPSNIRWRLKQKVRRFALGRVDRIIVFSRQEVDWYSEELRLSREKFQFVPFHTNIEQAERVPEGVYGFAAGRSLRDWKTLFAAVEGLDCEFVVVADQASVQGLRKPPNLKVYCDIPRSQYLELLRGSRFVVVPLLPTARSSGQVVILEAASLGKPVIASNVSGVRDYITDGHNGLLVEPQNAEALREAMCNLNSGKDLRNRLAEQAFQRIESDHTFPVFVDRTLSVVRDAITEAAKS